jgi:cellulose synthase/poly-beta-1,6-N-acetylglucosamine synthase-like glycosyltransferase
VSTGSLEAPPPPLVLRLLGAPFNGRMHLSAVGLGLLLLFCALLAGLTFVSGTTLWWMLHAWRTPDRLAGTGFAPGTGAGPGAMLAATAARSYSLIVPARHEEAVLGATLERLAAVDHPDVEILAVVGHDDPGTRAVAEAAAAAHPDRVRVVVDHKWPKNKPKALNTALAECRGEVTGVFDAEDEVHPKLLQRVDRCFDETGADVVQGGVQLMNYRSSWWSLHNVLEYYFWFRSRLHFHADRRFIPLGGNTVFVRTDLLRAAEGWDEECLAEDCELGVRLSTDGAKVAVAYEPGLVTREETPPTIGSLLRQRTRWNQGFLQVLHKGVWRRLPSFRQRMLARYTLSMPFLQAVAALLIPLSVVAILALRLPVAVALFSFVPLVPTVVTIAVQAAGLREFCRSYGQKARPRDYLRLVAGAPVYQLMLGAAAVRAVVRQLRHEHSWEKTAHVGAHRGAELATTGAAS